MSLNSVFQIENNKLISSIVILSTSILMVSKIPTYSLKRISIPRKLGGFLLLGIGTYISLIIYFPFEILFLTVITYIFLIPISFLHYKKLKKKYSNENTEEEDIEDIL